MCWRLTHSVAQPKRKRGVWVGTGRGSGSPRRSDKGQGMRRGNGSERSFWGQRVDTECRANSVFFPLLVEYTLAFLVKSQGHIQLLPWLDFKDQEILQVVKLWKPLWPFKLELWFQLTSSVSWFNCIQTASLFAKSLRTHRSQNFGTFLRSSL